MEEIRMLSPRLLIPGAALAALAILAGPASSQRNEKPRRTAPRIEVAFHPSAPITAEVDLRPEIKKLGLAIRDQGTRGTCSVFATTFLIEYQAAHAKGMKDLDLSEEYLNWAKNRANNSNWDGGMFTDIIRGYQQFGMVPISDMPYEAAFHPKHPDTPTRPVIATGKEFERFPITFIKQWDNQKGMSESELEATKAALKAGHPVATGIWWLENFETVTFDHVPLLKEYPRKDNNSSAPPMYDGHSIDLVGFHEGKEFPGGGYFIFRNSFGPGFGHNGYGFVSFKYIRDYSNDAIRIEQKASKKK
jgi:C1A family cysteine protease